MGLTFIEGFDRLGSNTHMLPKWDAVDIGGGSFPTGRFGGKGIDLDAGRTIDCPTEDPGTTNKIIVGFAIKVTSWPTTSANLLFFKDATVNMLALVMNHDGTLHLDNGGGGPPGILQTTHKVYIDTWTYVEVKVLFKVSTTGTADISIDGRTPEGATGLDTIISGSECDNIRFLNGPGADTLYDDLYVGDTSGSFDFLGDSQITALVPNADNSVQHTPLTGTTNFSMVDEATPDGDTSHNQSATAGHRDTFDFSSGFGVAAADTVHGMGINFACKEIDGSSPDCRSVTLSGASNSIGATKTMTTSYTYEFELETQDPDAGPGAWDNVSIDAAKFGYENL